MAMQITSNDTGQSLDDTGLLFDHARYNDLGVGRFVSADTVVPGNASGEMDGIAGKSLTVDFHEGGFLSKLNQENGLGFWFTLSDKEQEQAGSPWGPANAQALNRYSYVQNNPLRWMDPSGHTAVKTYDANSEDEVGDTDLDRFINFLGGQNNDLWDWGLGLAGASAVPSSIPVLGIGLIPALIGATELAIVSKTVSDTNDVLDMLRRAQKFLSKNGGGTVRVTIDDNGYVKVEAFSNQNNAEGHNYYKQYLPWGISLASARYIQNQMNGFANQ